MNENKVPCGGFRIGDGLAMDGDTLKSLGGTYVKVKVNTAKKGNFCCHIAGVCARRRSGCFLS